MFTLIDPKNIFLLFLNTALEVVYSFIGCLLLGELCKSRVTDIM